MATSLHPLIEAADKLTDGQIMLALQALAGPVDHSERMVRVALMTVLESRHDIADAMEAWSQDFESDQTQEEAMIAAVLAL